MRSTHPHYQLLLLICVASGLGMFSFIVSGTQPSFYVDDTLAFYHSPICRTLINRGQYKLEIEGNPTVFEFVAHWFSLRYLSNQRNINADRTLHIWIFADKLGIAPLQHQAVDIYFKLTVGLGREWGYMDSEFRPMKDFVALWKKSEEGSQLRNLLIRRHAGWSIKNEVFVPREERFPLEIREDVREQALAWQELRVGVSHAEFHRRDQASNYYVVEER